MNANTYNCKNRAMTLGEHRNKLQDGKRYWLGACHGTYNAKTDTFDFGNCFVPRADTRYA